MMKNLTKITILFLTGIIPLSLNAQAPIKSVGKALVESAAEGTAKTAVESVARSATQAAVANTAQAAVANVTRAGTIPLSPIAAGTLPLTAPVVTTRAANAMDAAVLSEKLQKAVAAPESTDAFLDNMRGEQVFNQLSAFVSGNHRFPEQHFGEDVRDLSSEELLFISQESALRQEIDLMLANAPDNIWSKEILALREDLAEYQLENLSRTFSTVSSIGIKFPAEDASASAAFTEPLALNNEELPNAYQLSENFYRGGQPTLRGYEELARRGVKTIISFRTHRPNVHLIESLGMESVHIPLNPALITPAQMTRFLQLVSDPAHQPVYVHCRHGSDRTGTMVAMYRTAIQKWPKEKALAEMKDPQFGFHKIFFTLPSHIKMINTTKLRGKLQK